MAEIVARSFPIAAVIAVVLRGDRFLLVRRSHKPDAGRWGFPGGKIESGETIKAAALRELEEESGVVAEPLEAFTAVDVIRRDGAVLHHYVLIAVLCRWMSGNGAAASDAEETGWFDLAAIRTLEKSPDVEHVAELALSRAG